MSWKDIIKAKKIDWYEFKRSLPEGTNVDSLNSRSHTGDLKVIFQSENILNAWMTEHGEKFLPPRMDRVLLSGGQVMLSIPKRRFDRHSTGRKLATSLESDTWEFEEYYSP